jgi:hypothetical protein
MALQGYGQPYNFLFKNLIIFDFSYKGCRAAARLATISKNGDDLALPGKGPRAVGYPYISYLPVARICTFS